MVYCGKPSKGCALCRAKRTKVCASVDSSPTTYLLASIVPFAWITREIDDASVTKLARLVPSAGGLEEIAQDTATSKMRCFAMRLAKS